MDRIQEIIRLESEAVLPEGEASRRRWECARLMWEEVQAGKSRNELAEQVGKSRKHVQWMVKSWEVVGQHIPTGGEFPPFNPVYSSPEVRGESARKGEPTQSWHGGRKEKKDYSSGQPAGDKPTEKGLAAVIAEAAETLGKFPAFWELLDTSELEGLRQADIIIRKVLRVRGW